MLLLGGAAVAIAGLTTLVPPVVLVIGLVAFVLGAALPLWSFWRRRSSGGRTAVEPGRLER